jgi:CspA family cold shock protein
MAAAECDGAGMIIGTVKFFDVAKGFGFVTPTNGEKDIFVHVSGLARDTSTLLPGERVSFRTAVDRRTGKQNAVDVRPIVSAAEAVATMQQLRNLVDDDLAGVANEQMRRLRFLLDEIEQIVAAQ